MKENSIEIILSDMIESIRKDPDLAEEKRDDLLRDINFVKRHLDRTEKNDVLVALMNAERNDILVALILNSLQKVPSLTFLVEELRLRVKASYKENS